MGTKPSAASAPEEARRHAPLTEWKEHTQEPEEGGIIHGTNRQPDRRAASAHHVHHRLQRRLFGPWGLSGIIYGIKYMATALERKRARRKRNSPRPWLLPRRPAAPAAQRSRQAHRRHQRRGSRRRRPRSPHHLGASERRSRRPRPPWRP